MCEHPTADQDHAIRLKHEMLHETSMDSRFQHLQTFYLCIIYHNSKKVYP